MDSPNPNSNFDRSRSWKAWLWDGLTALFVLAFLAGSVLELQAGRLVMAAFLCSAACYSASRLGQPNWLRTKVTWRTAFTNKEAIVRNRYVTVMERVSFGFMLLALILLLSR